MKAKGLYVHIPFCLSKCAYCDFCSFTEYDSCIVDSYVDALTKEIRGYKRDGISVDTIFIGGGTPSILSIENFEKIIKEIKTTFNTSQISEFTVEMNPRSVDEKKLRALYSLGVNRLSIGLQSVHENELKILGRNQSYEDFIAVYNSARAVGFTNISVDVMYGIPSQTMDSLSKTLDRVLALSPEHISLYSLIIEEGTPIYENRQSLSIPDDDTVGNMYDLVNMTLMDAGYIHYEISNYSRVGLESRHNMKYWMLDDYIGVGISAHSFNNGARYFNPGDRCDIDSLKGYINDPGQRMTEGVLGSDDLLIEYIMLSLRTNRGIILSEFHKRFNKEFTDGREGEIAELLRGGLAVLDKDRFYLSERGMLVSNSIICELLKNS